jgi:glycine betaine/proline transport system substrate-binding protein
VKDKWPGAYKAIQAFTIDNDEMGQMITKVDLDGKSVDDVVAEWVGANEARWSEWIKK